MNNPEFCILKLFVKDKESYLIFYDQIKSLNYDTEIKILLNTVHKYYTLYTDHSYIGKDELKAYYTSLYSVDKNKELIYSICDTIYAIEVSDSIIKDIIRNLIEKDISLSIIDKLTSVVTENKYGILSSITEDVAKYEALLTKQNPDDIFVTPKLNELIKKYESKTRLQWLLKSLQDTLGDIQGGTLGHVFARPDSGKTSFLMSEITHITKQIGEDECNLWINNEQRDSKIYRMIYASYLGLTENQVMNNIDKVTDAFIARGGGKLKLYDNAYVSIDTIKHLIKLTSPRVVVIDQGDKVAFSGAAKLEGHSRLKELYRMFREIAKEYDCHIITVGQASAEAAGKKWLEMHHMDCSKTSKPAEMDYILGIGKLITENTEDTMRYLNFCKNKDGNHAKHIVQYNNTKSRYVDV